MTNDVDRSPWPETNGPLFAADSGPLNASPLWTRDDYSHIVDYTEGYRGAATALYEGVAEKPHDVDAFIFPIAFLWRQYVELQLKEIIALGGAIAEEGSFDFRVGHDLEKLWARARPLIEPLGAPDANELIVVSAVIREFNTADSTGEGFRYPFVRDLSRRTLENAPRQISLTVLHERMQEVAAFFGEVRSMMRDHLSDLTAQAYDEG